MSGDVLELERRHGAANYHPLPVVVTEGEGAWVRDRDGRRYLDCLAGYSALNFGHRHPAILAAASAQLSRITLTSRAFHNDQLGPFCAELAGMAAMDLVLPMNTGAEAVETALKVARKWGYRVRGVPTDGATIVAARGGFHGRTITQVGFSTDPLARADFGPYAPGFRLVDFGDAAALEAAIDASTVAVLLEPVQGEAGVVLPPDGYLTAVRRICDAAGVLWIADEVQSGLGRTGYTFACEHERVRPDVYVLGKALGGGVLPVSAVVAGRDVLGVIRPGQHGSTFGGNPLAAAVGRAVIRLLATGELQQRSTELGDALRAGLAGLPGIVTVRGRGLWTGVDIDPALATGRQVCERLAARGVLSKDTHGSTIRLSPPLIASNDDISFLVDRMTAVLKEDS